MILNVYRRKSINLVLKEKKSYIYIFGVWFCFGGFFCVFLYIYIEIFFLHLWRCMVYSVLQVLLEPAPPGSKWSWSGSSVLGALGCVPAQCWWSLESPCASCWESQHEKDGPEGPAMFDHFLFELKLFIVQNHSKQPHKCIPDLSLQGRKRWSDKNEIFRVMQI